MSSPRASHSTSSPITEVPHDILGEIFAHCLPQCPLEIPQPDTTFAPMLLCQICSSWRTIVLSSPSLWSHLWYRIHAQFVDSASWAFLQKEIDFLMWWKRNQGSIAPFLRLEIWTDDNNQELSPAEERPSILLTLLQYVTSAQYLHVEPVFWDGMEDKLEIADKIVFSNLHTLVTYGPGYNRDHRFSVTQALVELALPRTPSLLRRLTIDGDALDGKILIPSHWSALTHLSLSDVVIPLNFWFSLVRTVPDLQWAYILFDGIFDIGKYTEPPTKYTLLHLSTLFIAYNPEHGDRIELPFTLIFSTLYLPALRTLSLSSFAVAWRDHHAISELTTALHSTPAIMTLALRRYEFLSLEEDYYSEILAAIGDVEPIWGHVPHLTHLQFELPDVDYCKDSMSDILDTFVCNVLSNRSWLDLDNPACPIKAMTFSAEMPLTRSIKDVMNLTMSSIQKHTGRVSNIAFKVINESDDDTGALAWKEWSSRIS